jgi:ATP-dependent RNA helicase RhlE
MSKKNAESFAALDLAPALLQAVGAAGYTEPTPIQKQAIPHVLAGRDLLGCAQTGTGKTAAFALPILHRLLDAKPRQGRPAIRALVLAPTRELAAQIGASFGQYGGRSALRHSVVFGGVGKRPQVEALRRGFDVLVATPGRLLDLMNDGEVSLAHVRHFVLDEADRMLDMGFIDDVRRITKALPKERQTLLFSATMPREIQELADRILVDPVRVAVDRIGSTVEPTSQSVYLVESKKKVDLLLTLLQRDAEIDRALVFTRTKRGADRLARKLTQAGVATAALHGNKSQNARERALDGFKRGKTRVVVATDVAARGIDVKELSHVVNFDLPADPESYVHRVGRTGRAGLTGVALSLCSEEELGNLQGIERFTQRRLERLETPRGLRREAELPHPQGEVRHTQAQQPQQSRPQQHARPARSGQGARSSGARGRRGGARSADRPQRRSSFLR